MKQDKNARRIISEEIGTMSPYDMDGSIESVVKKLQERYLPTDRLDWCWEHDDGCYRIIRDRPENDKEYAARMADAERARDKRKKAREQQTARERAEYERLKKKFERS